MHPHTGLQTVSWLFNGEVEHRDSLGSVQKVRPGELNIMTAGIGIAHSELSTNNRSTLHGVQLWTVLPDQHRNMEPSFDHYNDLPVFNWRDMGIRLFVGEFLEHASPAKIFSPMMGAEVDLPPGLVTEIPVDPSFEYGLLVVSGQATVNGKLVQLGQLHYLPAGKDGLVLSSTTGAKLIFLGGEPFREQILMWWNFVARSYDEIQQMREDWQNQGSRFPAFQDRIGGRIPAPPLPNVKLRPRGNPSKE